MKPSGRILSLTEEKNITAAQLSREIGLANPNKDYIYITGKNGNHKKYLVSHEKMEQFKKLLDDVTTEIPDDGEDDSDL